MSEPTTVQHTEQEMPIPNTSPSVQGLVRQELAEQRDGNVAARMAVIADLEIREQVGTARYGTCLQPFNGRDAIRDAYEEALDLTVYLRQAIEEGRTDLGEEYRVALWLACRIVAAST
jgi:hypothetical protein